MTTLEQVEKLRERADVSFEAAKEALEQSGGDLLDALIFLERQGKTAPPTSGGYYSGETQDNDADEGAAAPGAKRSRHAGADSFKGAMRGLGSFLLGIVNAGNKNHIDAMRHGEAVFSCPVTVFVILLVCAFWVIVPLIIISLFFSWRYRLRGPNLGRESINSVIENAEAAVEDLKNTVVENAKAAKAAADNKESTDTENL